MAGEVRICDLLPLLYSAWPTTMYGSSLACREWPTSVSKHMWNECNKLQCHSTWKKMVFISKIWICWFYPLTHPLFLRVHPSHCQVHRDMCSGSLTEMICTGHGWQGVSTIRVPITTLLFHKKKSSFFLTANDKLGFFIILSFLWVNSWEQVVLRFQILPT